MKRLLWVAGFLMVMGFIARPAMASETITLATVPTFPPFLTMTDGLHGGIDVAIVKEAARRAGVRLAILSMPWKRVISSVRNGEVMAGMSAFKTPEREAFAYFTDYPVHLSEYRLFVRSDSRLSYQSVESLRGRVIGLDLGFAISPEFDAAHREGNLFQVEAAKSVDANLRRLVRGRIDGYVGQVITTMYTASQLGVRSQVKTAGIALAEARGAYLFFSRKVPGNDLWTERFNLALKSMSLDGSADRILANYVN